MSSAKWLFPDQESGLTDYHSIPTEKALDSELETFVREVLQNANDQGLPNDDPVKVTFDFQKLTDELDTFLNALQWDNQSEDPKNLKWHIDQATENEQARDPGLKRFVENFERDELLVLSIHDENTTGLVGNEDDSSDPYGALVKDFGGSEKPESSSGGSHGVGKTVLWAFSSLSTVLFNSNPHDVTQEGRTPPRLIGRSILPAHDHEDPDRMYTNHGWFGYDDSDDISRLGRPPSLWNDDDGVEDLAEALQVDRITDAPGTTIGVVGFRLPGEDLNPDPNELAADFRHAAVKHFWPAISRGDLEVYVRTPDGETVEASWDDAPGVEPYVKCYRELFDTESDELDGPGSIAKAEVELTVPRENGEVVESPHPEYETEVDLLIRQLNPDDSEVLNRGDDNELTKNRVARLRGAQMIVDYVNKGNIADRGSDFVSVLVCGEAQSPNGQEPTDEQKAVEKFLKRSEPTQHDDWKGSRNDYLKKYYKGTIVREIAALSGDRLEAVLADVVHDEIESGDEVPDMDDVAPIMGGRSTDGNGGGSAMNWETRPDAWFEDGRWHFHGKGGPDTEDHGEWEVTLQIDRLDGDESTADSIPIESVTPGSAGVTVVRDDTEVKLIISGSVGEVEFEGRSEEIANGTQNVSDAFEIGEITEARLNVSSTIEMSGDV